MGSHAALLLAAALASGTALAHDAAPSANVDLERIDAAPRSAIRWRLEVDPPAPFVGAIVQPGDIALAPPVTDARRWRSPPRRWLTGGMLLRAPLSDDTSLMLRLRGGTLGVYVGVRLGGN